MKNKDLINLLQGHPEDTEVLVWGDEGYGDRLSTYFSNVEIEKRRKSPSDEECYELFLNGVE